MTDITFYDNIWIQQFPKLIWTFGIEYLFSDPNNYEKETIAGFDVDTLFQIKISPNMVEEVQTASRTCMKDLIYLYILGQFFWTSFANFINNKF